MATRDLLDPRWHWLRQALDRLYRELEPGTRGIALGVTFETSDGEMLNYQIFQGDNEIHRLVLTGDGEAILSAIEHDTTSLTPDI